MAEPRGTARPLTAEDGFGDWAEELLFDVPQDKLRKGSFGSRAPCFGSWVGTLK